MKKTRLLTPLLYLPTPSNITYWWNLGSLLGLFLSIQIISGIFLSMHYCPNINMAFHSIIHMIQNVNNGWLMHNIHVNGASLFFLCMYLHIGRGVFYSSFKLYQTWILGSLIFITSMATAFLGYVLPWGQMSFWGATVITNLLSSIPFLGPSMVHWLWGGFSVNNATLNRFYTLHFILPFLITLMALSHLFFLHKSGSSNPLGLNSNYYKLPFHIYFTLKDTYLFLLLLMMFTALVLGSPYALTSPDNFIPANPLSTPAHIQPEWYFLFAYAILRSIPNKLGGVTAMATSILIILILPLMQSKTNSLNNYPPNLYFFWLLSNNFILLSWLGAQPIEYPYIALSQGLSSLYFLLFLIIPATTHLWDLMLYQTRPMPQDP